MTAKSKPWLVGGLPRSWGAASVGALFDVQLGKMLQRDRAGPMDAQAQYLKAVHVRWEGVIVDDPPRMWASPRDLLIYGVSRGDLLVCEGGEVGRSALLTEDPPEPTIIQNALHRVRPRGDQNVRYLKYVLELLAAAGWFDVICNKATIAHFTVDKFRHTQVPVPPEPIQRAIADFLDRKTAAIDELIRKKERLIKLLQEKRQALITQAVTKGLDPNVPMKDSGIEWLGEIPAHWNKMKLRRVCGSLRDGTHNPPPRAPEGQFRLLSARNIVNGELVLREDDRRMTRGAFEELERSYSVRQGDVVVTTVGGTTGKSGVVRQRLIGVSVQRSVAICRPRPSTMDAEFLELWISSLPLQALLLAETVKYAAQPGIYLDELGALPCLVPRVEEQVAIRTQIRSVLGRLARTRASLAKQIELLAEYRQTLISAAVTGQLPIPEPTP